jgi:hypothetical protein
VSAAEVHFPFGLFRLNADWIKWRHNRGWRAVMHVEPYGFFDDAGKWEDRDFICLCGYFSDGLKLEDLTQRWNEFLADKNMTRLHMTEFYSEAKKKEWDDDKCQDVLLGLARIARDHINLGFCVGLDAKHYRSIPKTRTAGIPRPNVACLQRVLWFIRERLRAENYDGRIEFTLDEEEGSVVAMYKDILALRKSRPDLGRYIGAVCFADDTFFVPLQAADMLANLTYRWFQDRIAGKASADELPEPLKSLIISPETGRRLVESELWDASALDEGIDTLLGKST